jgi:dolichol-phosphate mannosyltransferase
VPKGGFDLWLFDRKLRDEVVKLEEKHTFLPYLFLWLGYPYKAIPITRRKRTIGKSRWTFGKKVTAVIDSFISFTYLPLRVVSVVGIFLSFVGTVYACTILWAKIREGIPVPGWTSLTVILLFVSSFQMIAIGIIGEYLWRTLEAARHRPNAIVESVRPKKSGKR